MALKTILEAVRAIGATDPSISADQLKEALFVLDGKGVRAVTGTPPPRSYSGTQVAALMGVSRKCVTNYAKRGLLVPIYSGAQSKRAMRYSGESVATLLSGKATATTRKEAAV